MSEFGASSTQCVEEDPYTGQRRRDGLAPDSAELSTVADVPISLISTDHLPAVWDGLSGGRAEAWPGESGNETQGGLSVRGSLAGSRSCSPIDDTGFVDRSAPMTRLELEACERVLTHMSSHAWRRNSASVTRSNPKLLSP